MGAALDHVVELAGLGAVQEARELVPSEKQGRAFGVLAVSERDDFASITRCGELEASASVGVAGRGLAPSGAGEVDTVYAPAFGGAHLLSLVRSCKYVSEAFRSSAMVHSSR